jgi:hypothetical protein
MARRYQVFCDAGRAVEMTMFSGFPRVDLVIVFSFLFSISASAQKLTVVDTLTDKTRHIKKGKIIAVATKDVIMNDGDIYGYRDTTSGQNYFQRSGTWRLTEIDDVNKVITITAEGLRGEVLERKFRLDEVRYITYVRSKKPDGARTLMVVSGFGGIAALGGGISYAIAGDGEGSLICLASAGALTAVTVNAHRRIHTRVYWYRGIKP